LKENKIFFTSYSEIQSNRRGNNNGESELIKSLKSIENIKGVLEEELNKLKLLKFQNNPAFGDKRASVR